MCDFYSFFERVKTGQFLPHWASLRNPHRSQEREGAWRSPWGPARQQGGLGAGTGVALLLLAVKRRSPNFLTGAHNLSIWCPSSASSSITSDSHLTSLAGMTEGGYRQECSSSLSCLHDSWSGLLSSAGWEPASGWLFSSWFTRVCFGG